MTAQETWGPKLRLGEGGRRVFSQEGKMGRGVGRSGWVGKVSDLSIRAAPRDVASGMHYIITNHGGLPPLVLLTNVLLPVN